MTSPLSWTTPSATPTNPYGMSARNVAGAGALGDAVALSVFDSPHGARLSLMSGSDDEGKQHERRNHSAREEAEDREDRRGWKGGRPQPPVPGRQPAGV